MLHKDIIVRPATTNDATLIAQVVAMAIGDEQGVRNYCGEEYIAVLSEMASREDTQYSWPYALVAEVDGIGVGAVVGYDGAQLRTLREGTFRVIEAATGRMPDIVDETTAGEYYLDSVGVLPHYRGRGIGRALVTSFCDRAFAEGHRCVGLIVDKENPSAENLYTSIGFERVGSRPFFTHDMWHLQRWNSDCQFSIHKVEERPSELINRLTTLWEASVRATHHFLSESDICEIREYVPMAISGVKVLVVAHNNEHSPIAFMGVEDGRLEMLFVEPSYRGKGVGGMMVKYGIDNHNIKEVTVNEQNPSAVGFYEHMGFVAYRRSDCDEQGRPFPLIYMVIR